MSRDKRDLRENGRLKHASYGQKGVTYCRRRVPRAIFLPAHVAFLPVSFILISSRKRPSDPPRDTRESSEHAPLRSHVSRDLLIPQTLTRTANARFPARAAHTSLNYHLFSEATCVYFHNYRILSLTFDKTRVRTCIKVYARCTLPLFSYSWVI